MADRTSRKRPITIFSILALIVLVVGGGLTVLVSFARIDNWMKSGERFAVGVESAIEFIEPGEQVIFFETRLPELPAHSGAINFHLIDGPRNDLRFEWIEPDAQESYAPRRVLPTTKVSGRPLWRVTVTEPGLYTFRVDNYHLEQDPENDRIVFGKNPQSFREVTKSANQIKFGGLAFTGVLFVTLYVLHAVVLSRRAKAGKSSTPAPVLQRVD